MADFWVNGIVSARDRKPYIQLSNEKGMIAQLSMGEARQVAQDILVMCSRTEADALIIRFFEKRDLPENAGCVTDDRLTILNLVDRYEAVARPWLNRIFQPSTCIEQTRVLVEVMKRFGLEADGLGVKLLVTHGTMMFCSGLDAEETERARTTCLSYKERPNNRGEMTYGRHVVALIGGIVLADSTVSQANAAFDGAVRIPPEVLAIRLDEPVSDLYVPDIRATYEMARGSRQVDVRWIATCDRDWEQAEGWEPSHLWPLIDRLERDMRSIGRTRK